MNRRIAKKIVNYPDNYWVTVFDEKGMSILPRKEKLPLVRKAFVKLGMDDVYSAIMEEVDILEKGLDLVDELKRRYANE